MKCVKSLAEVLAVGGALTSSFVEHLEILWTHPTMGGVPPISLWVFSQLWPSFEYLCFSLNVWQLLN